jgi:hypothetical protein
MRPPRIPANPANDFQDRRIDASRRRSTNIPRVPLQLRRSPGQRRQAV